MIETDLLARPGNCAVAPCGTVRAVASLLTVRVRPAARAPTGLTVCCTVAALLDTRRFQARGSAQPAVLRPAFRRHPGLHARATSQSGGSLPDDNEDMRGQLAAALQLAADAKKQLQEAEQKRQAAEQRAEEAEQKRTLVEKELADELSRKAAADQAQKWSLAATHHCCQSQRMKSSALKKAPCLPILHHFQLLLNVTWLSLCRSCRVCLTMPPKRMHTGVEACTTLCSHYCSPLSVVQALHTDCAAFTSSR